MPFFKTRNQHLQDKCTPIIIKRDYYNGQEPFCFYCEGGFVPDHKYLHQVWDYLNNDEEDIRPQNLVWAHWMCSKDKKNIIEFMVKAGEKLKENAKWIYPESLRESEREKKLATDEEELTDAEVGRIIGRTTETYLDEHLKGSTPKEFLLRSDARACIAYLVKKETNGRGSLQAVDRAIDIYCCKITDYVSKKEDGKRIIRLRKNEEKNSFGGKEYKKAIF